MIILLLFSILVGCEEIAIEFSSEADFVEFCANKLDELNLELSIQIFKTTHLFKFRESKKRDTQFAQVLDYLDSSVSTGQVTWFEEQAPRKREKRLSISDPLYKDQWHLHGPVGTHLDITSVWDQGNLGQNVRIAIVDDGLQTTHPDLVANVRTDSSYNFNRDIKSPDPTYMKGHGGDWHGTASAGVAAARNDGYYCGVGVAPHAELAGIAILQNNAEVGDAVEAAALSYMPQRNHIYSNSWGPIKPGAGGHRNEKPKTLAWKAILEVIKNGRNGLGGIYVWAAGNDGYSQDNCNYDGYASMRYAVTIGAADHLGQAASYSEPCSAMLALAPGGTSKGGHKIPTTDLMKNDGLDEGNCTRFSGTSAACPIAAGIVALALSANPDLSWLELQYVLIEGAIKYSSGNDWVQNAAGYWHSNSFGFGLLSARKVVERALFWKENQITVNEITVRGYNQSRVQTSSITITDDLLVHHVEAEVWTEHQNVAKVTIILVSPAGTQSVLATPHSDVLSKWDGWSFLSRRFHGEPSKGSWTLIVSDQDESSTPIRKWNIIISGRASNPTNSSNKTARSPNPYISRSEWNIGTDPLPLMFIMAVTAIMFVMLLVTTYFKRYRQKTTFVIESLGNANDVVGKDFPLEINGDEGDVAYFVDDPNEKKDEDGKRRDSKQTPNNVQLVVNI